ncbi:MAG: rod-binding protein [Clostridiaceae bacterium]|jgi:flagellar protein FlgJ|nr:rod-binding protein [Clostridiaceae bacterium]
MIDSIGNVNNIIDYNSIKGKSQQAAQGDFEKALEKAMEEKDEKKLKEACSDLEAIFVSMMFKQMRNTVQKSGLFDGGMAEEVYEDMLYDKYAEEVSKGSGTGLGDLLYRQLSKSMKPEGGEKDAE